MGPIWGQQDPGGPDVGPMNFAVWDILHSFVASVIIYRQDDKALCSHAIKQFANPR